MIVRRKLAMSPDAFYDPRTPMLPHPFRRDARPPPGGHLMASSLHPEDHQLQYDARLRRSGHKRLSSFYVRRSAIESRKTLPSGSNLYRVNKTR